MTRLSVQPEAATLGERFRALQAERERSWSAEALSINANQRATLRREHGRAPHVRAGDTLPDAVLRRADGGALSVDALVAEGPAVLVFFRFAGCPACNIALPYYRDTLYPALAGSGIPLVAISPQPQPQLGEIVRRHALPFEAVTDERLALARALGITYVFDDASRSASEARGDRSEALNGIAAWELPKPTVLVVGPDRVVRFVDISPDWMDRTEAGTILAALGLETGTPVPHHDLQGQFHVA